MEKVIPELVFQVGMVVPDLDKILENLRTYFDLDESSINVLSTLDQEKQGIVNEVFYDGKPCKFHYRRARLNFGGIDFEYIEPLNKEGGDPYSDWLKEHGPGIQHINVKLKNRDAMDKIMADKGIVPHILTRMGNGMELEAYDFREMFGFIGELGDMVVGPMAEEYNKKHNNN